MKLKTKQALQQAIAAHKKGEIQEAERLYRAILQSQPLHPDANHNLGVLAVSVNNAEEALSLFKTAIESNPMIEQFWLSYIDTLIKEKQFDNAKQVLEQAKKQGVDEDRLNSFKVKLSPKTQKNPPREILNSLLKHYQNRQFSDAEKLSLEITQDFPKHQFAWKILGAALRELGRNSEALDAYQTAVALSPQDTGVHNNMGIILQELGRFDEAETSYKQAIALKPDYAEAHNNLGITFQKQGRFDEAEKSYKQAIALKPDYPEAHLNLCELLRTMNRVDELLSFIRNECRKILEMKTDFLYYEALIEFRKENYEIASELIEKININELMGNRQLSAMKLQGDIQHHKKNYSAAFESYKFKNKLIKDSIEYKRLEPEKYFIQQKEKVTQIKQLKEQCAYKSVIKPNWIQPTFLIGFPRSGTTLLDTILRTHSNIDVLEELPMLNIMNASLGNNPTISMIEAMDSKAAEIASGFYFEELKKHIEVGKKHTIVDKLPLNILQLPLINQVFPNSKYIIAIRHPLDCVMSCWMQNFELNLPMANMIDFERIVEFYDVAMSILKLSEERYLLDTHRVRYEDLVLDFEENVTNILTFLELKWEEKLRNYEKTALNRSIIGTPSSSQVIKPIYKTASYRWKHYEEYLKQYKTRLMPWIHEFGYK